MGVPQEPTASVWSGVYTDTQATRGEEVFRRRCTYCHGIDLAGAEDPNGPALKGSRFLGRWQKRTVAELWDTIGETMPANNPGILDAETCTDLVAYLLKVNGAPAGPRALSNDPEQLERLTLARQP